MMREGSLFCLLVAISVMAQCSNCGIYVHRQLAFDSVQNKYIPLKYTRDEKAYYKDSCVIRPTTLIRSATNAAGGETWSAEDNYVTYIDFHAGSPLATQFTSDSIYRARFPHMVYYQYPAFSKDAMYTKKYNNLDSALRNVGWGVQPFRKRQDLQEVIDSGLSIPLPDTIINGISYMRKYVRIALEDSAGTQVTETIGYYNCVVRDWMLSFIEEKNEKGCILCKIETIGGRRKYLDEFEFTIGLTKEQIAIFDAWERNTKKYPLH